MVSVHLQLSAELLEQIDQARQTPHGTVPRNAWIRRAITEALAREEASSAGSRLPRKPKRGDAGQ